MLEYMAIEIFTNEAARWQGKPLADVVVRYIAGMKIAARCIATRGTDGCYESGEIATRRAEVLSNNMPVRIYIILPAREYDRVMAEVEKMVTDGIVIVHPLDVVSHKAHNRLIPKQIKVRDVMTPNPKTVTPSTPLDEVAGSLLSSVFTGVPVVDENARPIGVVTQGDLIYKGGMPIRLGILADSDEQSRKTIFQSLHQKRAEEIMTRPAVTIEEEKLLADAVAVMINKNIKRLPVIDSTGRLTGMLSRMDVFHTIMRESPDWKAFREQQVVVENLRCVSDIMRLDTHAVLPDTSVEEVVRVIDSNDIQRIAVVDGDGKLLGMISDRDLLVAFTDKEEGIKGYLAKTVPLVWRTKKLREIWERIEGKTASEIMKTHITTIREDAAIEDAIRIMTEKSLKRLPILDSEGRFKGMISRDSLLRTAYALSR
jgi:CBS domain-containing protein